MPYLWFKAFHLIGVVVWFAGLFYLVRLFVYHVEANEQPEAARAVLQQQYQIMEKRLYNLITTPGMVVTVAMAIGMLVVNPAVLHDLWLHVKLSLVGALIIYHFYCGYLMRQFAAGNFKWGSQQLRGLNEVPTVFLVLIVMLAVFKNSFPTGAATWAIVAMVIAMFATIQLYARKRRKDKEKLLGAETALGSRIGEFSSNGSASEVQTG